MLEKRWYYSVGTGTEGPVSLTQLQQLADTGVIAESTLVWINESDKRPFSDVQDMMATNIDEPAPIPRERYNLQKEESRVHSRGNVAHPWFRFLGRMIDYAIFSFILGFLISFFRLNITMPLIFLFTIPPFLWIFLEALLLCTWGTTPGKWLINTKVRKGDKRLSFAEALHRSFAVWWLGMGAGILPVSLITLTVACTKLSHLGITTWDRAGQFDVTQGKIHPIRAAVLILFCVGVLILFWMTFSVVVQ